ncbi:MAG: 1-acyl-sn-glycerol-3-phosphate acyltransferase [Calothrix sp. C42_A2020_038]|nr:1-acyl-sn-glycerol-3-phosphate acyltransferase [Calothrix sp. C42_A2020_038]
MLQYQPTLEQECQILLPKLAPETINRAREGVAFARCMKSNKMIEQALSQQEAIIRGGKERRISGTIRRMVLRGLIHTLFSVRVENSERIPNTSVLFAANHLNHIDPFLLLSELPAKPFFHILGDARTLYNSGWKRLLLRFAKGVIPLERMWKEEIAVLEAAKNGCEDLAELAANIEEHVPKGNSIESMRRLDRVVQGIFARGESVMLFPEGKLGNVEGQLLPLKRGAVIYALRSGVPIVPIALIGTKNLFLRKQLTVRIGEPLIFPQCNRPKAQQVQTVCDELYSNIQNLLSQDYEEPKGAKLLCNFLNHLFW